MLDDSRVLEVLAADVATLGAIDADGLQKPVGACPGWTVSDLIAHLGRVHHRAIGLLDGTDFVPLDQCKATPVGDEATGWSRQVGAALVDAAQAVDPDAPTDTWMGPRPARFWLRRMMQETSIHRWDAEAALGDPGPIAPDVGVDGVDEHLTVFCSRLPPKRWAAVLSAGDVSLHLHATDAEGEWLLHLRDDGLHVTPEHAKGDVAVRGGGGALDLVLWNRLPATTVEVFGDHTVLARFLKAARF